ncbi:hypothetical protein CSKR_106338 [Clonorchis sinensis]|uniref:Uncharacterized protein n=1 Tax=Clonorchis sinensis TaxID=79923 RepID=A0A419Q2H6_CLOSI|nr:hypothetical protein CSKR_106338 [Clonorchis sinensis]
MPPLFIYLRQVGLSSGSTRPLFGCIIPLTKLRPIYSFRSPTVLNCIDVPPASFSERRPSFPENSSFPLLAPPEKCLLPHTVQFPNQLKGADVDHRNGFHGMGCFCHIPFHQLASLKGHHIIHHLTYHPGPVALYRRSKTLICISFTKLNIHLLLERVFLNFSGYSLTVTQMQANATKRLHKFSYRSHFSKDV